MPTDVIIEPGSGQIYWNDSAGSPQSISIKGDAQNTISVVGYSGAFSPGSSAGGTFIIASFNDNSGTSAFVPGTTNYDLGSSTYRWSVYGYTGNFSSDVVISSSTQSTSVTSGALRVNGGVGISGRMYFNTAAMGTTGIASPPTFAFIGSTGDPIYLQVLEDNSIAFEGSQGQLFSITPNLSTGYIYSVNDITGIPLLRANANANVTANEFGGNFGIGVTNPGYKLHVVGSVGFTSVTASTSPTTGTLVVSGGVGVGGTLNIGGRLNLWNSANTNFTSFVSTATGNTVYNLPATTPATGSSVLQSDSIGNLSWVGFVANSAATATTAQNINSVVASTSGTHFILFSPVNGGSGIAVSSDSGFTVNPATNVITANTFSGNISATGTTSGFVGVTDNTASTSTTTGALVVSGGVGIGRTINIGGRATIGSTDFGASLSLAAPSTGLKSLVIRKLASQSANTFEIQDADGNALISTSFNAGSGQTGSGVLNIHANREVGDASSETIFAVKNRSTDVFRIGRNGVLGFTGTLSASDGLGTYETIFSNVYGSRVDWQKLIWFYGSGLDFKTAGSQLVNASSQLQITNSGTSSVSGVMVIANGWDAGGATRVFGIGTPGAGERSYFKGYGNLVINPNNPNGLHAAWNTMDLISLDISGTATTYSGNIIKGSVEGTERFSVGPFGNTRITVGTATTATGFIVKAVASQTGNLIETQSSAGATNFYITPAGNVNVSSTTPSTSSSTGALVVSGGVGIGQTLNVGNELKVQGTSASTSTTTGALVVAGGVGIGQSVNIGGRVGIGTNLLTGQINIRTSSASTPAIVVQGSASQTADYAQFFTSTGTTSLSIDKDGKITFPSQSSIQLFAESYSSTGRIRTSGPMIVYGSISSLSDGVNESYLNSSQLNIQGLQWTPYGSPARWSTNNAVRIQPTSTSVVPLVVQLQNASWTSGNAFEIQNNSVLKYSIDYAGSTSIASTTGSGSTTTGALIVTGGVGIGGSIFGGSTISAADNIIIRTAKELRFNNSSNTFYTGFKAGTNASNTTYTLPAAFPGAGTSVLQSDTSGTLSWVGSIGTATTSQNINVVGAGSSNLAHSILFTPIASSSGSAVSSDTTLSFNPSTEILSVSGLAVTAATGSSNTTTGALVVSGGVGIAQTAFIGGNVNILGSTASTYMANGALTVAGGVGISGQLSFNRAAMGYTGIASNPTMAFIGTTGSPITLTVLSDNGLQFEGTSGKLFGINNNLSTGWIFNVGDISGLPLIRANADGTVAMGEFAGNIGIGMSNPAYKLHVIGSVGFTSVTASTNPTSGTLVVSGGAGIGQSLNVGGRLHLWNAANTNFTAFLSAASANHTYTFPANVPSTGTSVLQADTSGILSWVGFSANSASIATTAQNLNTVAATTSATHYLLFSPVNGASGVAVSSDTELSYNPSTNVLSASVFSGNISATAVTSTNFFGTLTGNVTGNVTGTSTTSQNVNTVAATTSASHYLTFSPVNGASGVALSSDANLTFNPATNVLTTDIFSGNASGTAATFTNFFGTHVGPVTGNVTGTATTSQNINLAAGANNSNHSVVFSLNATGSGVALSSDAGLQYNPSTNVLTADVFSGNVSATAVTATNFFGTFQGSSATAVTSQNINTTSAATSASHYILFSPVNATTSGVAVSSDASLQFNPATNVLTVDVFSGNLSATAATATNFFGTHVGPVTGNVTGTATTSQNVNTVAATTSATHYLTFSPVNGASGVALSSDANLTFNPSTNVLTTDVFSGNVSATAVTSTNFFGTLTGNVTGNLTGTATTAQNVNLAAGANASNHSVVFSLNATGTGIALSSDAGLQYNPSTNVLTADVFSGNVTGTAITATNFFGTFQGSAATAVTAQNVNVNATTINSTHFITFTPASSGSGLANSTDTDLTYNPGSNVLTAGVFSGNASGTAATYTNFYGTHVGAVTGNVTGNVTGTATTSQNINTTSATTAGAHYLLFSPVTATASGVAVSSDSTLQFNPGTNVLTTDVFSGNLSATAATATNFFGTLVGNSSTATTAANMNVVAASTNSAHYITFSPASSGSGLATSADADLAYNPSTNVLTAGVFSGNLSATAATATNFFGTLVGNSSTATTATNVNLAAGANASNHSIVFSLNATGSGVALSSDAELQYNPSTNALSVGTGNITANTVRIGNTANTIDTSSGNLTLDSTGGQINLNDNVVVQGNLTVQGTTLTVDSTVSTFVDPVVVLGSGVGGTHSTTDNNQDRGIEFRYSNSGTAVTGFFGFQDTDFKFKYIPNATLSGTNVYSGTVGVIVANIEGNVSGTAITATNFFGTLVGNSSTATTSRNVNTVSANTSANHFILFSPVDGGSGVAVSSDSGFTINPATNVVTAATFAGNLSATAATSTNFFGALTGNVTGTATTSQNVNTVSATTSASHFLLFSPVNGASGVAVSSDTQLTYNPATDVLSATTFSGNVSATAVTATNFFGTLVGNTATATTSQNINTTTAATASAHYILFSPVNATASGVAVSSDSTLQFNPGTNVLTTDVFSGNLSATAATATNFFGTHVGPVTGNVTGTATTSQNINTTAATTAGVHYLLFSPVNATASGVAVSSDSTLQFNPGTNVLTTDIFSGNLSATAATATNFFGTLTGNVTGNLTGTATTAQNVNVVAATTAASHFITFSPASSGSGLATSADTQLTYNPATDVLSSTTFSGNLSGTAVTATNFFGTLTGNVTGTSTTSQNINTTAATTAGVHYLLFSPVNATASGVAVSSDSTLQFNPGTNVLTTDVFSGNLSATAATATNFFGNLTGNVTGTATTAQNINLAAGANNSNHSVVFSLNATGTGVGLSSDAGLQYNPSTNVLTSDVFSGNFTGTAATATNFYGTLVGNSSTATTSRNVNTVAATTSAAHYIIFSPVNGASGVALSSDAQLTYNPATDVLSATTFSGNVTGTATTAQNINLATGGNNSNHSVVFSLNATGTGVGLSSDGGLQYNPSTHVLTTDVFSGNFTGTAATATNFFGTLVGNSSTATTSRNVNTVVATTAAVHYITFSPVNGASGVALSSDAQLTYNPATDVLSATTFFGNVTGTAITATNFYGTLIGSVGTATTSQNINTTAATTAGVHYLLFSPVNATASGVAVSSDATLQFNPGTNVLTTDVFSGNLSATAATAANFYGTHIGNVTGTATTAQNVNTVSATTSSVHYITFSPINGASGVALSSDAQLTYNPATDVLSSTSFSGNVTGTAITATNFFGSLTGTATTSQNINTTVATTAGTHYLLFSPVNATASGIAVSSDATLQFNPGTNVLTTDVFSGNLSATAATATNFYGTHIGNVTGTATTAQNVNLATGANNSNHSVIFSLNATGTGVGLSSDAGLQYNPSTNVLTADVFNGNVTGTAITATNFFGTHVGAVTGNVTGTATTSQNVNTVSANTSVVHYITFSPVNGASGVALSSDAQLTYNPATDVVSATTFSGNVTGTAITATNFYGTLVGSVGTATTSQNINTTAATTAGVHYLLFSPVNATTSGVAVSSDATLQFNPGTNVLTTDVFSGNLSGTAATATNFYGTHIGNVTGTATTAQNINLAAGSNNSNHSVIFSLNATGTGVGLSSDAGLQYNPSTNVLTADVFSGNFTGTAATVTNFFGTHVGAVTGNVTGNVTGTATTSQNLNTVAATTAGNHFLLFSPVNGASGVAVSSDATLQFNPATNVLTTDVFSGNVSGTAVTATNFFGTLTGNVTGTATTAQNINLAAGANNSNHSVVFSLNATGTGVGLSSDAGLQYNPSTNVLTADVFSGNFTGTAATVTNFYGTHVGAVTGNVTGTATTAQNVNVVLATTAATHFITFSPASSGSGLATSADTQLTYNPATDVLSATTFSGNVTGTAITATNFYGTLVGSVGTATTSANINTVAATTAGVHYLTFSPVNGASGVALSSDASLQFNPGTNVLTTDVFSGNLSATATTSGFVKVSDLTPSFSTTTGALVVTGGVGIGGSIFTSPTSKSSISGVSFNNSRAENGFTINASSSYTFNIQDAANNQRLNYHADSNRTEFTGNNATHEIRLIHSNNSGYTGFKANSSGAVTYILPAGDGSNGQLLQTNGTGTLSWATVSGGAGSGSSGVNAGGQYQLAYYASTGGSVDGSSTFTNNTSTSTVTISHGTSSTATNIGALVVTGGLGLGGNAFIGGTVTITNSTASTTTANGALVVTGGLGVGAQINSASIVTSGNAVFNGNLQFKGTGTFGDNAAVDTIAYNARSTTDFNPSTSNSVDLGFNTLVWRNLFANFITGSAVTATNFYGTLAGNVTGTSTTSQNINSVAATTAGTHYLLFSPVNGASGVAVSSEASLQFNPGTNVLTTDVFAGNLSATAATATNFYGTHIGNVTGTSTTSQNINTTAATTAGAHYLLFSPVNATASGVAVSSDATLQFNPGTNVLTTDVFSGNLSATAATSGRFAVGNLTYAASNLLAAFQSSVNGYNQVVIQNSNNGASASSDLVVNNDISTDTGAFGTFGMNSSGFTGLGSTNIPNAVYVTAATAELVLGTTTNNRIRFVNENVDTFQITATGSSVYTTTATLSKNSGAFVVAGGAAIGLSLSVGQGIQLYNSTNGNHTGFKAGATSANSVYTLPLAYPSTGSSILQSDTAGTMIWVNSPSGGSATPAGNTTELQYNNAGAFGGATGLTWQNSAYTLQVNSNATHTTSTQVGFRLENGLASGGQATRWSPTFEMVGRSGIANVYYSRFAAEVVPSGPATYASALRFKYSQDQGTASYSSNIFSIHSTLGIGIGGSTVSSNFMSYIRAHESQAADISYKLPLTAPGTGASFLQCDTSGNMSWVNSPGGGSGSPAGSPKQIQYNNNGAFGGAGGFEYITVGGSAVTVSMFSVAGGGYTSGLWVNVLSASSTRIGIGISNPQYELEINGELSATNKSFVINHPTKPGMKLRYGSLEGPENGVYVRGELNGSNIIEVPDHWIGLVHEDSYTVHLTPIGRYSQLYVEKIENYNVYVADNFMNPIHCYYSVWAERKDIPKLVTEY